MPAKKAKMNGFLCYMLQMRPILEAKGHLFPNGMPDVHAACTPLWDKLTSEQKAFYNNMAKGGQQVKQEKLDSRGVPISFKENEEKRKKEEKTTVFRLVEDMVTYIHNQGNIKNQTFHLIHFNYAVETEEKEYPPCEVAVVKYSLLSGITEHYHDFIDPGKLRMGYSYEAKTHSEATHNIPSSGFKLFNKDYVKITDSIKSILREADGTLAPVFVLDEEMVKAKYILDWLIEKSRQLDSSYPATNPFNLYSLNKLFLELRRHADLDDPRLRFTSTYQAAEKLNNGSFDYCPNMACEWHEEEDKTKFCSLTRVRNYAYVISDFCCEIYGLRLLPNHHCPASIADEARYVVQPPAPRRERPAPTVKDDEDDDYQSSRALPRLPHTLTSRRQTEQTLGSRVAANFSGVPTGMGRGILGSSTSPSPGPSPSATPPPAGRGRGRGLLMFE